MIPYDQQGYNIFVEITKITQRLHKHLKWKWLQSHQKITSPGEWVNDQEDKLAMYYMTKFLTLPDQHNIPNNSLIKFYINSIEVDNKILFTI